MLSLLVASALAAPDIESPLRTGAKAPDDAAVVIGIEDYAFIGDVPYASRDARVFYDFLLYTTGVPAANLILLDRAPNREKILQALDDAAQRGSGRVWVYFAGHGAASPTTGERMILGVDAQADLSSFEARSVSLAELREHAGAGGGDVLLVLDTCYTGQGRGGTELLAGKRFAVPSYATEATASVVEWSAASANEFSGPYEAAKHGAFTYFVVGALRGWADGQVDGERDGTVTLYEADLYVQDALRAVQISDQRPVMTASNPDAAVLASDKLEDAPELSATVAVAAPATASAKPTPVKPNRTQTREDRHDDGSITRTTTVTDGGGAVVSERTEVLKGPNPLPLTTLPDKVGSFKLRGTYCYEWGPHTFDRLCAWSTLEGYDRTRFQNGPFGAVHSVPVAGKDLDGFEGLSVYSTITSDIGSIGQKTDFSVYDAARAEIYECTDAYAKPSQMTCLKRLRKFVAARAELPPP